MTNMSLTQRIQLEQGKLKASEVVELHLDHAKSTDIEGLSSDYSSLKLLSLSAVGLEKLAGLPELPALKTLDLSNNNLKDGLDDLLRCPNLEQLNLSANNIDSIESLAPLSKLSTLKKLDLFDCDVAAKEGYRKKVFEMLPHLIYLDGLDQNENEEPSDQLANGGEEDVDESGANGEDDEDEESDDDDEEYGIEALQRSGDLDDDEEDYAPDEDDEDDLDEYEDLEDDDDDVEEDEVGVNLSGSGVSEPRRPGVKRQHDEGDDSQDVPAAKHKPAVEEEQDAPVNNGSTAEN